MICGDSDKNFPHYKCASIAHILFLKRLYLVFYGSHLVRTTFKLKAPHVSSPLIKAAFPLRKYGPQIIQLYVCII